MKNSSPSFKKSLKYTLTFLLLIWLIEACKHHFHLPLHYLGIYPQSALGLIGVITAPLIHGSWEHVINNSAALLLLGTLLLYSYSTTRWKALAIVWLVSGLGVWLFGRPSFHYGASGLTHGIFYYLLVSGILRRDKRSVGVLMIAFFMYGSMLLTILPQRPEISFEAHFFGGLGGVIATLLLFRKESKPKEKTYEWEGRPEEDDPFIGDEWQGEENSALREIEDVDTKHNKANETEY
jgi:membrane associated rhomboid family serine protease